MKSKLILSSLWAFVQVAEALRERAQRIYEKYGNVMLETEGMTKAGIERKATCPRPLLQAPLPCR